MSGFPPGSVRSHDAPPSSVDATPPTSMPTRKWLGLALSKASVRARALGAG
jgi:hypothetical protein